MISEHNNVLFVLGKPDDSKECSISIYSLRNFFKYGKVTVELPNKPVDFQFNNHTNELIFLTYKNGTGPEGGYSLYTSKFRGKEFIEQHKFGDKNINNFCVDKLQKDVYISFEKDRDLYVYEFGGDWK